MNDQRDERESAQDQDAGPASRPTGAAAHEADPSDPDSGPASEPQDEPGEPG